jgi:hypothetical protein
VFVTSLAPLVKSHPGQVAMLVQIAKAQDFFSLLLIIYIFIFSQVPKLHWVRGW